MLSVHSSLKNLASLKTLVLAAAVAALAACAAPAPPKDNFHRLSVAPPQRVFAPPPLPGVLEINRPDVDGVLSERAMAYQEASGVVARYNYDYWSNPPAQMLQDALAEALDSAHAADHVVTPDLRVPPDWTLRGRLKRFESVPGAKRVDLRVQLAVVSARDGTLVLSRTYDVSEPVAEPSPAAAAAALGQATSQAVGRLLDDLGSVQLVPPGR